MAHNQQQQQARTDVEQVPPPAECSITVTNNMVQTYVRAGQSMEETVSAAHQEARWALERSDVLVEKYNVVDVRPK